MARVWCLHDGEVFDEEASGGVPRAPHRERAARVDQVDDLLVVNLEVGCAHLRLAEGSGAAAQGVVCPGGRRGVRTVYLSSSFRAAMP